MINDVINRYILYKKSIFIEYAYILNNSFFKDEKKYWRNDEEFKGIINDLSDIYLNKYYDVKFYNNVKKKKFDNILLIVKEYYKDQYQQIEKEYGVSLNILTTIFYTVTEIDKLITCYSNDSIDINYIISCLKAELNEQLFVLNIEKNDLVLKLLANVVKKSEIKENAFFEALNNNNFKNEYARFNDGYLVNFIEKIPELEEFSKVYLDKAKEQKNIYFELKVVEFELLSMTILRLITNNVVVPKFFVKLSIDLIDKGFLKRIKSIMKINWFKGKINFIIDGETYIKFKANHTEKLNNNIAILVNDNNKDEFIGLDNKLYTYDEIEDVEKIKIEGILTEDEVILSELEV